MKWSSVPLHVLPVNNYGNYANGCVVMISSFWSGNRPIIRPQCVIYSELGKSMRFQKVYCCQIARRQVVSKPWAGEKMISYLFRDDYSLGNQHVRDATRI